MSTDITSPTRARRGERIAAAIAAIRQFEAAQFDWSYPELAGALGCSPQQARALVATLVLKGHLEYRETTVRKSLPRLTETAPAADASQAGAA